MTAALAIAPVVKSVSLACSPAAAFAAFTGDFGVWWPRQTHSLGADNVERIVFEGHEGGRIYEIWTDGTEKDWGRVTRFEPGRRVTFTWHVGRTPDQASEVDVTVSAEGTGSRVELVHSGWEALGENAPTIRDNYNSGWVAVFEKAFGDFARTALQTG